MGLEWMLEDQTETGKEGETVTLQSGSIPDWLKATIYTTAPGKFTFSPPSTSSTFTVNHFNDGFAILSKFILLPHSNQIQFKKVYERSDARKKADAAGKPVLAEYFTKSSPDVTKNRLSRWMTILPQNSDNGNHNIYKFGNKLFTTNGLAHFREIDPDDLSEGFKFDTNKLFGLTGLTPHPIIDDEGNFYNSGGAISPTGAKQVIIKVPAEKKSNSNFGECAKHYETIASWPMNRMMHCTIHHSFAMTKNQVILVEMPFTFNIKKLFNWVFSGNPTSLAEMTEWRSDSDSDSNSLFGGNPFIVVEKNSKRMIVRRHVTSAEPFFFLHCVNSFEDSDPEKNPILVLDLVTYPNTEATMAAMYLDNLKSGACCAIKENDQGIIHRYVIPLSSLSPSNSQTTPYSHHLNSWFGAKFTVYEEKLEDKHRIIVSPGLISSHGIKSVAINPKFRFKKYRFIYGNSGWNFKGRYGGSIVKFDLNEGKEKCLHFGNEYFVGEMVFVPRNEKKVEYLNEEEDDGALICALYKDNERKAATSNSLVIVCARRMEEIGRATFQNSIPIANHAIYGRD